MSRHDDLLPLYHMRDHAKEAVTMAAGRSEAELSTNRMLELSLVRLVETIGEAATRISGGMRDLHPEIEWRVIVGMRNRLIHGYDAVAHDVLWDTITLDLPPLIEQLERIIAEEEAD